MSSYNESALNAYERDLDRRDAEDAAFETATDDAYRELKVSFLLALSDETGKTEVPFVVTRERAFLELLGNFGISWEFRKQPIRQAIFDAFLDDGEYSKDIESILLRLLAFSECPIMKELRVELARAYASIYAPGLAQINMNGEQL